MTMGTHRMKHVNFDDLTLFEWLTENDASIEQLAETDKRLFSLIEDYVRLMEAMEYWGDQPKNEDDAFHQLLKNKEYDIMMIIASSKE